MTAQGKNARALEFTVDVVIPVLNEAHVLELSIAKLRRFLLDRLPYRWRVLIVDNGSTDGTIEVARNLASCFPDVVALHLEQRGRGRALRHAWTQSSADIVCYMDVDLSTELEALPRAVRALLEQDYDIAVGSRLMRDSRTKRSLKREIISRIYNVIVKLVLSTRFSDAQCGFKAITREVVEHVVAQVKDQSWFFDTELMVLAEKQGYRIKDIPVVWNEDDDSRVKIAKTAWDDLKGVWRLRWFLWSNEFSRLAASRAKESSFSVPRPLAANSVYPEPPTRQ